MINTDIKELLPYVCSLMSISGHEKYDIEKLYPYFNKYFDEKYFDSVGNIMLIRRSAKENAAKIMIDTHFDEIGMIVSKIHKDGFLSVVPIGGLDCAVLQATDVIIYGKEVIRGVIASTPPHLSKSNEKDKLPKISELLIDTGYDGEEIQNIVSVGAPVGFVPRYTKLFGESICGKSLDDKACAAAALSALAEINRDKLAADVCLLLSCHEEVAGIGGVSSAAFSFSPDYAMVIDVNLARVPDVQKNESVEYEGGISITHSPVTDRRLTMKTEALCKRDGIKFTRSISSGGTGTNTPSMNLSGRGVPTVDIGLPLKSMHTCNETVSFKDIEELMKLISAFVCSEEIMEEFAI